ncbi:hypothetical protein CFE70_010565 [Pyrenophora teres f. teres 0-1]
MGLLAPVGAVGEVLVEGPVLGREYIDEPDKTASTFIELGCERLSDCPQANSASIRPELSKVQGRRSIELIGRKDNQVKLRGQRIE